ncbi:MAG: oxidoreductase [Chitinophagaceae bacterium]|nr:oxidoreductase [Chitinophagaceae bacterium]
MKKTIAVVGSSNHSDSNMVFRLAALGYPILLADEKWECIRNSILSKHPQASVEMLQCSHECAWQADLILLYLSDEYKDLLDKIKTVVTGKLVINVVNHFLENEVQQLLPFSKVVHANIDLTPEVVSFTVRGENNQAVEQALLLFDEIGFKSNRSSASQS